VYHFFEEDFFLSQMKGFRTIEITVPELVLIESHSLTPLQIHYHNPSTKTKRVTHSLFVKPNDSKQTDLEPKRTLFVLNIPMDASLEHFEYLFRDHGKIERIKWPVAKHPGFSCHIIFEDEESIEAVMEMKVGNWKDTVSGLESFYILIRIPG
jgi:hypothetical protein